MPVVDGIYYSDMLVGEKRDVSDVATILAPGGMAFANNIGMFPGDKISNLKHEWVDDARVPFETTLNGAILVGDTSVVFTDEIYKVGDDVIVGGEVVTLTVKTAAKTFTMTRSTGGIAAAGHADGTYCSIVGNPAHQGIAAGDADFIYTPQVPANYGQRVEYVASAADEANEAERYGQPGRVFDDNVRQKIKHAMIATQMTQLLGPLSAAAVPTGGATTGKCKGVNEWFITQGNSTDIAAGNLSHSNLREMADAVAPYYEDGESIPMTLLHPTSQGHVFTDWQQAHVQVAPGDPSISTYGVPGVRRLNIGAVVIDCVPMSRLRSARQAICYKADLLKSKFVLPLEFKMLGPDGGRQRGMVSANSTIEVRAPAHGWTFYNVA